MMSRVPLRLSGHLSTRTGVAFSITCIWNRDTLTYAFDAGTADVGGDDERQAVRRAFATWSANVQLAFREVGTGDNPDILIAWTQANCGDANMAGGTLAHADYPPGCGYYGNALPRPLHFNDQEHAWCIGPSPASSTSRRWRCTKSATFSGSRTRPSRAP